MHCRGRQLGQEVLKDTAVYTHRVSKNAPSLASCSFYKHGLILIFFGKQRQHIFKNDMSVQLCLSLHSYLFYLVICF